MGEADDLAAIRRQLHAVWLRQFWQLVVLGVIAVLLALIVLGGVAVQVEAA